MKPRFAESTQHDRMRRRPSLKSGEGVKVEKSVTIARSASELYRFWREFENLPQFMQHVQSVSESANGVTHWVIKTAKGRELQWDARLIEDKPDKMISWQSLQGADVDNAGSVWFIPAAGGRGTVVKVVMKYSPPGGKPGAMIAKLLGESGTRQIADDVYNFKSLMETGEIPTTQGQPAGNPSP
jgi:uncharacterized membrane protein